MNDLGAERPVAVHPLAELIAGLAAAAPDAPPDRNYPQALRKEAGELVATVLNPPEAAELSAAIRAAGGVAGVLSELVLEETGRPRANADSPSRRALTAIQAAVDAERLRASVRLPDDFDRLTKMEGDSRYTESPLLARHPRVQMWPVRLLPPAPAGKLFVKELIRDDLLQLAFGDLGQVNAEPRLDWPQWYRLGVWHATLNRAWAPAVAAAASPHLEAAFARLPVTHRRKVGVHEAQVSVFPTWAPYFLDSLVAAGKVLLEESVAGHERAAEQARWFRSLGRVHIDWFLQHLQAASLENASVPGLAAAWLDSVSDLSARKREFYGPIAACESPIWNDRVEVMFSPSIDRVSRRSLTVWLKTYWPADVTFLSDGTPQERSGANRIVYALYWDEGWTDAFTSMVSPESRELWSDLAGRADGPPRALVYAHRSPHDPSTWTRLSVGSSADELVRAQRLARPYADWTAVENGEVRDYGRVDYDRRGVISFTSTAGPIDGR